MTNNPLISLATLRAPEGVKNSLSRYIIDGTSPSGFTRAVLENDLTSAVLRGDDDSLASLVELVRWLHGFAPPDCWGSSKKVDAFIESKSRGSL